MVKGVVLKKPRLYSPKSSEITLFQVQLSSLEVLDMRSSKAGHTDFDNIILPNSQKDFQVIYANQREYYVPSFLTLNGKRFEVETALRGNGKCRFITGSGSIVTFYKNKRSEQKVVLKTCKFYNRKYEYKADRLVFDEDKINKRWRDEWSLQRYLKNRYEKSKNKPIVEVYGGVLYKTHESYQVSVAMERMDVTLSELVLSNKVDVKHLTNAALALRQLHKQGIVYCDLKPSNILVSLASKEVKFADFDCSCLLENQPLNNLSTEIQIDCDVSSGGGSEEYLSPERVKNRESVSQVDDIWSFGVVLLEVIKGHKISKVLDLVELDKLEDFVENRKTQYYPRLLGDRTEVLKEMVCQVLNKNSTERPSLEEIIQILQLLH